MLDDKDFENLFITFQKSAFRWERLESYCVDSEAEDFKYYLDKNVCLANDCDDNWLKLAEEANTRGKIMQRVCLLPEKLGDYLRFEINCGYIYSAEQGEKIYFIPKKIAINLKNIPDYDFWLLDDKILVKMNYDNEGNFLGAENINNEQEIQKSLMAKNLLLKNSLLFEEWMAKNKIKIKQ